MMNCSIGLLSTISHAHSKSIHVIRQATSCTARYVILCVMPLGIGLFALGLIGALIVNYLADVLPRSRGLARVSCRNCATTRPLVSYLFLRRCSACGALPPKRTYMLLVLLPIAFLYLWLVPPHQLELPLAIILVLYLALVVVIDIEHRLILLGTSIFGALLGLAVGIHIHSITPTIIGGAAGYAVMLLLYLFGELFVRLMSRRREAAIDEVALGFGDVNLAGIAGLFLGWPGIAFGLVITVLAGGLFSLLVIVVMLLRRRYRAFSAIPYGPFLALSIAVLLLRP
jgi:leader peptidase (prepilin peptidase)/N-methyltransferase